MVEKVKEPEISVVDNIDKLVQKDPKHWKI